MCGEVYGQHERLPAIGELERSLERRVFRHEEAGTARSSCHQDAYSFHPTWTRFELRAIHSGRTRCPPLILFFCFLKFEHQETDTAAAINTTATINTIATIITVVMSSPLASPASTAVTPALIIPSLRRVPVPGPAPLVPADFPDDDKLKIFPGELTLDEILPRGTIRPFSGDDDSGSSKKPRL